MSDEESPEQKAHRSKIQDAVERYVETKRKAAESAIAFESARLDLIEIAQHMRDPFACRIYAGEGKFPLIFVALDSEGDVTLSTIKEI